MSVFGELRRRSVFRVGIAYLAAVWVLIQVADVVLPNLGAPAWLMQALIYSSAVGFPLALILSWFYELTPEGIKATADADAVEAVKFTGRKIDFAIIGLLVLAVGVLLVRSPPEDQPLVLPNSVAVLPFENLNADPENVNIAAGIHASTLHQLARVRDLNVIARTSVLQYAENPPSIPEIASVLRVEMVMEGSVRYANGRVVINAQLIDGQTGDVLLPLEYDGDLADIFAVQADIATRIANALEAEFSPEEQARIERVPTDSGAAHVLYLRALATPGREARGLLDQAIERDEQFALAYAERAYMIAAAIPVLPDIRMRAVISESADRALQIDPELGRAYAALALLHQANARWDQAREMSELATQFSPKDPRVFESNGVLARYLGDYPTAIELGRRAVELDPHRGLSNYQLGITYRYAKQYDAAYEAFGAAARLEPATYSRRMQLGFTEIMRDNDDAALHHLQVAEELSQQYDPANYRLAQFALGYSYLGRPDDAQRFFSRISEADPLNKVPESVLAMAYIAIGDYEEALLWLELAVEDQANNAPALAELRANSYQDEVLEERRFRVLRYRIGT